MALERVDNPDNFGKSTLTAFIFSSLLTKVKIKSLLKDVERLLQKIVSFYFLGTLVVLHT